MTSSLQVLFDQARSGLEPTAAQIATGRARLQAAIASPGVGTALALGAGGVGGIGIVVAVIAFGASRSDTLVAPALEIPRAPIAVTAPPPSVIDAPPDVPIARPAAISPAPPRPRARRAAAPATAPAEDSDDGLAREIRLLRDARGALRAGTLDVARAALDEHARAFGDAQLAEEAALLRIDVAIASGDCDLARREAVVFVERWPRSTKRSRAERPCEETDEEVFDAR